MIHLPEMTIEEVDLEQLFEEEYIPCDCGRGHEDVSNCEYPAVTNALLELVCTSTSCVSWKGCTGWILLCDMHRQRAVDGVLRCGKCSAAGAYKILKEEPLGLGTSRRGVQSSQALSRRSHVRT